MTRQTAVATELAADLRSRKSRAVIATTPFSLAALHDHIADCVERILKICPLKPYVPAQGGAQPYFTPGQYIEPPELPKVALSEIRDLCEVDDEDVAEATRHLIHSFQIQHYRLKTLAEHLLNREENHVDMKRLVRAIAEAAYVHSTSLGLLFYARGKARPTRPTLDTLHRSCRQLSWHLEHVDELDECLAEILREAERW